MAISIQDIAGGHTLFGLSTDEKPTTKVSNGDIFICMDTQEAFFYDAENQEWLAV